MIRVILHGCNGKMGQVISKLAQEEPEFRIVAGVDRQSERKNGYPVYESMKSCEIEADVVIDFSNASALNELLTVCAERQVPVVLCTTALTLGQLEYMAEISKKIPILYSTNMSLGINLLSNLSKEAARELMPMGFDVEILEKHHNQKEDAPSGTAITLADAINEEFDRTFIYQYDLSRRRGKRSKREIGITSVRGGTIVGEHEVIFAGEDEVLSFRHTAYSKSVFGKGAIEAAKFLIGKEPGLYEMQDVLFASKKYAGK